MGELIRFVSSHEVPGLRHNMGASSATPVEKLRDKSIKKKRTYFLSWIMRFNYVAQPEDTALFLELRL
jgi:hypothetical protein